MLVGERLLTSRIDAGPWEGPDGDDLLLEREFELASLEALLESARSGRGGVILVEGEAGAGKSRLLRQARIRAGTAGMVVLAAHGTPLERDFAFGLASQLLSGAPIIGRIEAASAGADASGGKVAIMDVQDLLGCVGDERDMRAVLLTVDDVQWADEPSVGFLDQLAVRIEHEPVALVVSVRPGEPGEPKAFLDRLRRLPRARVLSLAPLGENAVGSMTEAILGEPRVAAVSAALVRAKGGNPFYLRELLWTLVNEGHDEPSAAHIGELAPAAVVRSIEVRLGRLGNEACALARAAAALGDGAPLRLAAALAALTESAAESAADALAATQILQPGEPLRFMHPLICSALEANMGAFERSRSHRRAADLLIADRAPVEDVAAHLLLARPQGDQHAVTVLRQAAARATASGAPAVAAHRLARALEEPPPPLEEPDLLLELTRAEAQAGSPSAGDTLESALDRVQHPDRRTDALVELATLAHHRGHVAQARELAADACRELAPTHPRRERLLAIELASAVLAPDRAEPRLDELLMDVRRERRARDPMLLALVACRMGVVGSCAEVRPLVEASIAADPLIDDSNGMSVSLIATALTCSDELELAERWLDDVLEVAEQRGAALAAGIATLHRATIRRHRGHLRGALADGEKSLEFHRRGLTASPSPGLASTLVALGRPGIAHSNISAEAGMSSHPLDRALMLEARARLDLAEGRPAEALRNAQEATDDLEQRSLQAWPNLWECRRLAASAATRLGDPALARELIEPDLAALRASGARRQLGATLTVAGVATGGSEGLDLLAEASALLEGSDARLQRAETLIAYGGALRRAGARKAATEPLSAALGLAAEVGAAPAQQQAREELLRLGLRPRRAARAGVASLTPTERRVAEIAAEGLTTPQIASRLFVSRNTIESHLRHIYRKLDLSGRSGLAEALVQAG